MNRAKIKSILLECLEEAGKLAARSIHQRRITAKKSELSLVTATDKEAEKIILDKLGLNFPDHSILSEESPAKGGSPSRWIIDPIDGTTNFAHTFPVCCISIGFEHDGQLEFGGVMDPFRKELFFAEKGKGATLNGKSIHVSKNSTLAQSLVCTGFPYDRRDNPDQYLAVVKDFMMKVQGIRRTGAAALDLSYIACGRFDGFWETKLNPWDKAAAMLLIEEAGGRLSNYSGEPLTLDDIQNVASNGLVHDEMLEVLKPYERMCK